MRKVFFGIGNIAEKTIKEIGLPDSFTDNSSATWGHEWNGKVVQSPKELKSTDDVIICTTSYKDVIKQLVELGIKNYQVSPVLKDTVEVDEIEDIEFDLLFASGLPSSSKEKYGGGIFQLKGNFKKWDIQKIYSGNCHCIRKNNSTFSESYKYFVTDSNKGLVCFNQDLEQIDLINFPLEKRIHGFEIYDDHLFIACSYGDEIISINLKDKKDKSFYSIKEFKLNNNNLPKHHINDLCVYDNYIYASMFSHSGSWQQGFLDGCIKKISIATKEIVTIVRDLKMPHNITVAHNGYYLCNSLNGEVIKNNNTIFRSNGFTRGLNFKNDTMIVGESKNRNFSNNKGVNLNSSLDSRINFVSLKTGAYKSVQLPWGISEIHSIINY